MNLVGVFFLVDIDLRPTYNYYNFGFCLGFLGKLEGLFGFWIFYNFLKKWINLGHVSFMVYIDLGLFKEVLAIANDRS